MERKNPSTSIEAYRSMTSDLIQKDHAKILNALEQLGSAIYEEIAKHLNWIDKNKVSRRLKELEGLQMIYKTGEKRTTTSNRNAYVYKLIEKDKVQEQPKTDLSNKRQIVIFEF